MNLKELKEFDVFRDFLFSYDQLNQSEKYRVKQRFRKHFFETLNQTSPEASQEFVQNFLQKKFVYSLMDAFSFEQNALSDKLIEGVVERNELTEDTKQKVKDNIRATTAEEFYNNPEYWQKLKKILLQSGIEREDYKKILQDSLDAKKHDAQKIADDLKFIKNMAFSMIVHKKMLQDYMQKVAENVNEYTRKSKMVTDDDMRQNGLQVVSDNLMGTIQHVCEETNRQNLFREWARIGVLAYNLMDICLQQLLLTLNPDNKIEPEQKKGGSGLIPMPM